jgi:tripartite-type tricarboxylate transporter receptor subunit TctC
MTKPLARRFSSRLAFAAVLTASLLASLVASQPLSAQPQSTGSGQAYPNKPVKIIVPFAPGGGNDFIARFIAQRLTTALGQQVVVENKPGGGGSIGVEAGLKMPADGYTLTLISSAYTVHPSLYKLKFDPIGDITPIIQISQGPLVLVVNPALPAKTIPELIALAKSKPGKLNFASSGQGSTIHLAAELFGSMAGIKMSHIPYKGTGPALADTISGQTDLYFSSAGPALPYVRAGRLRALGLTGSQRLAAEPEIATIAESGLPGYEVVLWHGLAGPKGLPPAITERINAEVNKILKLKETADLLQSDGVSPSGGTPEQLQARIAKEIGVWRKVISEAGIRAE